MIRKEIIRPRSKHPTPTPTAIPAVSPALELLLDVLVGVGLFAVVVAVGLWTASLVGCVWLESDVCVSIRNKAYFGVRSSPTAFGEGWAPGTSKVVGSAILRSSNIGYTTNIGFDRHAANTHNWDMKRILFSMTAKQRLCNSEDREYLAANG